MENLDRIIGEFLEINADIYQQRVLSKAPKLFSYFRAKYFYNKLKKKVDKLRKSNYILTKDNLFEYFMYLYNNYPPFGKYKSTFKIIYNEPVKDLYVEYKFREYNITFAIDEQRKDLNITTNQIIGDYRTESFNIYLYKLSKPNDLKLTIILRDINKQLLNEICDYILDTINLYEPKLWENK